MKKRKFPQTLSKWRALMTIPPEDSETPALMRLYMRQGYQYQKGFIATSHRMGINNDDFRMNPLSIEFFLMRAAYYSTDKR